MSNKLEQCYNHTFHQSLGELLLNFLYFYGYQFDYLNNYIYVSPPRSIIMTPFHVKPEPVLNSLMIVNPYNNNLVITKSFKYSHIMK